MQPYKYFHYSYSDCLNSCNIRKSSWLDLQLEENENVESIRKLLSRSIFDQCSTEKKTDLLPYKNIIDLDQSFDL